jgi:ligand-binding sensor domain-containing protein
VGTRDGGLTRLSINNNNLQSIQVKHYGRNVLSSDNVTAVMQDASGYVWIGTDNGLNLFNPRTEQMSRVLNGKKYGEKLANNYITSLCEDFKGDGE